MNIGGNSKEQLKSVVDRIERLEENKKNIAGEISDIYKEAKSNGFDVKALRSVIRMRKQNAYERKTHEDIIASYMSALGMLSDLPLGQAAIDRATRAS